MGTQLLWLHRQPWPQQLLNSGFLFATQNAGLSCHNGEVQRREAFSFPSHTYSGSSSTTLQHKLLTLLIYNHS